MLFHLTVGDRPIQDECERWTPDRDLVLDTLPGHEQVLLCVGAGHAFKFATQLGRMLAELALDGTTPHDVSLFRADRAVLSDPDAPRTWMV